MKKWIAFTLTLVCFRALADDKKAEVKLPGDDPRFNMICQAGPVGQ